MTPEEQKEFEALEAAERNENASNEELQNHLDEKAALAEDLAQEPEVNDDAEMPEDEVAEPSEKEMLDQEQMYEAVVRCGFMSESFSFVVLEIGDLVSGHLISQAYLDEKLVKKPAPLEA